MPENQSSPGASAGDETQAESGLPRATDQAIETETAWRWFVPACRGTFISRPNRFIALVDLDGRTVTCHCPNPGRMGELLFPGTPVLLEEAPQGRKTPYTLAAILHRPLDGSRECVVPVAASRANQAVAALVLPRLFPGAAASGLSTPSGIRGSISWWKSPCRVQAQTRHAPKTVMACPAWPGKILQALPSASQP